MVRGLSKNMKEKQSKENNLVTVHTCFSIEMGDPFPDVCACRRKIKLQHAKRWVAGGIAEWVSVGRKTTHDKICVIGGSALRTPRVATIEKAHIERAYGVGCGGDIEEAARIEAYGEINREALRSLTVYKDPVEFDEAKKKDWGTPVLYSVTNDRTDYAAGYAINNSSDNYCSGELDDLDEIFPKGTRTISEDFFEVGWWNKPSPFNRISPFDAGWNN